jgi:hypothetical protein
MYCPISILSESYHKVMHQSCLEILARLEAAGYACASELTVNAWPFCQRFTQSLLVTHLVLKEKKYIFNGSSKLSVLLRNNF